MGPFDLQLVAKTLNFMIREVHKTSVLEASDCSN
jgi:hypothetical protein